MTARAAPAIWPYPHRTLAEIFEQEKARGKGPGAVDRQVGLRSFNGPIPKGQRASSETCFRCGARSGCEHMEAAA